MQILFYLFIALTVFFTGSLRRQLVYHSDGSIAPSLTLLTTAGATILCYVFFKAYLLFFILVLALMQRLRTSIGIKIAVLSGAICFTTICTGTGPIGWTVLSITAIISFLILLPQVESLAEDFYGIFFKEMNRVFCAARISFDKLRASLAHPLWFLVTLIELPAVCGLAVAGMWQLMNWLHEPASITGAVCLVRLVAIIPLVTVLYRAYLRDTAHVSIHHPDTANDTELAPPGMQVHH